MNIDSRKLRTIKYEEKGIKIIFDPTVHVTRSDPTMTAMTLFSNIGGCVGLTLGFSILQMVEQLMILLQNVWKKASLMAVQINDRETDRLSKDKI